MLLIQAGDSLIDVQRVVSACIVVVRLTGQYIASGVVLYNQSSTPKQTSHNHCLSMQFVCNQGNHSVVKTTDFFFAVGWMNILTVLETLFIKCIHAQLETVAKGNCYNGPCRSIHFGKVGFECMVMLTVSQCGDSRHKMQEVYGNQTTCTCGPHAWAKALQPS